MFVFFANIILVLYCRPLERTVTMHKDSTGYIGFQFKNGKIIALVKDSSAARNGLLTDHQILEINGKVCTFYAYFLFSLMD